MSTSKRITQIAGLLLAGVVLISCAQAKETPAAQPATSTPLVTPMASLTPTNTPDPGIISLANASQIVLLGYLNKGGAYGPPLFSRDGKWLFQASTVGIYKYDTTYYSIVTLLASIPATSSYGYSANFNSMILSPDGRNFKFWKGELISPDGEQKLFDLEPPPSSFVTFYPNKTIFSPDGSMKAVQYHEQQGERRYFVCVWRLADGKRLHTFEGESMEFSADNRLIAVQVSVQDQPHIYLYDLQTGEKLATEWNGALYAFLPDNSLVVESNGYVRIFDLRTKKARHAFEGEFATFTPDRQMMAAVSLGSIKIYRVSDGKLLGKLKLKLARIDYAILKLSADGKTLVGYTSQTVCCGGMTENLFIWHVEDGAVVELKNRSPFFDISPDGETLAIQYQFDDVEVLRTDDGSLLTSLVGFGSPINNLAFTPDSKQIITSTYMYPNLMHLYDVNGGSFGIPQIADKDKYLPILDAASQKHYVSMVVIGGYNTPVIDSPDGRFSAQGNKYRFDVFDKLNRKLWFSSPANQVIRFSFSPDGQILAVGLMDTSVELWSVYGKEKLYTLSPRTEVFYNDIFGGLAFSPDGKLLAVGLEDGTLRLFGLK